MLSLEFYPKVGDVVWICDYEEYKGIGRNPRDYIVSAEPPDTVNGVEDWSNRLYQIQCQSTLARTWRYRNDLHKTPKLAILSCVQKARRENNIVALEKYEKLLWSYDEV